MENHWKPLVFDGSEGGLLIWKGCLFKILGRKGGAYKRWGPDMEAEIEL